jgi:hypothetical protein
MLYHVTDKDSGIEIWNNGLKSNTAIFSQGENPAVYGGRESDTC